jgi:hypothetical protein
LVYIAFMIILIQIQIIQYYRKSVLAASYEIKYEEKHKKKERRYIHEIAVE